MKFKKSALALCVTSALFAGNVVANSNNKNDLRASFGYQQGETVKYTIHLSQAPALNKFVAGKHNYQSDAALVSTQQSSVINQLRALDNQIRISGTSKLLGNFISVESSVLSKTQLEKISGVSSVVMSQKTSQPMMSSGSTVNNTAQSSVASDEISMMTPLTGADNAGEGATVAIISTGIDFTSSFFGGSGDYGEDNDPETPPAAGSYLEALENGAIGPTIPAVEDDPTTPEDESADAIPGYDGFPTDVVIGGKDLNSENYGIDPNPIDQNHLGTHWGGWVYPTGVGTELASIVHQLAPGAKLYAYKVTNISPYTWDPSQFDIRSASQDVIISALEHALDPNQDGDTSDHVDVALLDAGAAAAFFDPHASGGAGGSGLIYHIIQRASALGLTIVTHAGAGAEYDIQGEMTDERIRSWISTEGGATAAITVGSAIQDENDSLSAAAWSPMGPVRGSKALKPEIMAIANDIPVSRISQADSESPMTDMRTDAVSAAAKIAAAAAVIKANNPSLGPVEIKALLANTANERNIMEYDREGSDIAELLLIGHGLTDVEAAISSPVMVWERSTNQPYVQFGFHEVAAQKRVTKYVTVRNLSDTAQTYDMSYMFNGEKAAHDALEINYPASVNVPANSSVQVAIEVNIDGTKLPEWPLQSTPDFTSETLKSTELNGYFTFSSEGNPEINVGWMLQARNETSIGKNPVATEWPIYKGWNSDLGMTEWGAMAWAEEFYPEDEWGNKVYRGLTASFVNESETPTTFEAYPVLKYNRAEPLGKETVSGHKIRAVGGAIYPEAMCEVTGHKLSIAVNFFQPADLALANYMDKMGPPLFFYDLFHDYIVEESGADEAFGGVNIWDEADVINQPFVQLNNQGQPATYYIDYNMEYDWTQPYARYKESKLPTRFSNDGTNVVSEICVEELFHHELDSLEDFDQNLGFHLETDRDAVIDKGEPIIQFNPINAGYFAEEEVCQDGWFGYVCEVVTVDKSVRVGFTPKAEQEVLESAEFSHVYTAQPGEELTIAAIQRDSFTGHVGEFMVMSTSDNFFQYSPANVIDDDGVAVADVRPGQMFSVDEGTEVGTVVGEIQLDTAGFFSIGTSEWSTQGFHIMNTLPGTPFAINQETLELYVANPDALDYENQTEFELVVQGREGNTMGTPQSVMVYINNMNDVAPEVMTDVVASIPAVDLLISGDAASAFSIDFAGVFVESEGQALTYSVSAPGLSGVSINGTTITGSVSEAGSYVVTVTASDGIHEVSANFNVSAEVEDTGGSSGSMGGLLAVLAGFAAFRRRK